MERNRDWDTLDLIEAKIRELKKVPWVDEITSPATTEREDPQNIEGCDSLNSINGKDGALLACGKIAVFVKSTVVRQVDFMIDSCDGTVG